MLRKITLKNFMSHSDSEFLLSDGLNVLTGPNNCGKSAVISALQMLAELPTKEGDYMVRHGEKNGCQIIIETSEGDEIRWGRSGAAPYLEINGERHYRLSNDRDHFLTKLHALLRLPSVPGGKGRDDFNVHFATQKQPLFLIDQPPSRAAAFFASSSEAGRLVEMRSKFKDQIKEKSAQNKQRQTDKALLDQQLALLTPLDEYGPLIDLLSQSFKQLSAQERSIADQSAMVRDMHSATRDYSYFAARHAVIKEVASPPQCADDTPLSLLCNQLRTTAAHLASLKEQSAIIAPIQTPPPLKDPTELHSLIADLKRQYSSIAQYDHQQSLLSSLKLPPLLQSEEALAELVRALTEASNAYATCRQKAQEAAERLEQFIMDNPTCPTCLNPWKAPASHLQEAYA